MWDSHCGGVDVVRVEVVGVEVDLTFVVTYIYFFKLEALIREV